MSERGQRCDAAVTGTWTGSGIDEFFKPEVFFFSRMVDRWKRVSKMVEGIQRV